MNSYAPTALRDGNVLLCWVFSCQGTAQRALSKVIQNRLKNLAVFGVRTIGDAESGDGNPEFDTLVRIVRFLHIPGDALFYPETLRDESNEENEHLLAYRQLQARIATCDEQEILLLNAITEAALRVVRCKDSE